MVASDPIPALPQKGKGKTLQLFNSSTYQLINSSTYQLFNSSTYQLINPPTMKRSIIITIFVSVLISGVRGQQNDTLIIQGVNWNNHSETFHSSGDIISPQDTSQAVNIYGNSDVQFMGKNSVTLYPGFTAKASYPGFNFRAGIERSGLDCANAIDLGHSSFSRTNDSLASSEEWFYFIADSTCIQIRVEFSSDTSYNHIHYLVAPHNLIIA